VCGRYTLAGPNPGSLRDRFGIGDSVEIRQRFNVAPGDDVVCVTTDREGTPRGDVLRWGLVPHWAKDPATGYKMINARSETVGEKPAFRDALDRRRCLIVADGFYEWQPVPGQRRKRPFWITRADHEPFAFAGLWATWHGPDETVLRTCTILTTAANSRLDDIHDRMPVILPGVEDEQAWLDHGTGREHIRELLVALPDEAVDLREVGPAVSDARHDEPDCLDPPGVEDDQPGTLF
jgi:putative SOS response-associated peptidase YedK